MDVLNNKATKLRWQATEETHKKAKVRWFISQAFSTACGKFGYNFKLLYKISAKNVRRGFDIFIRKRRLFSGHFLCMERCLDQSLF
jgi:hypothetical protein